MANYDNLTPGQQAELDRLMTMRMGDWPAELSAYIRAHGPIRCGDQLADTVAGWVRGAP